MASQSHRTRYSAQQLAGDHGAGEAFAGIVVAHRIDTNALRKVDEIRQLNAATPHGDVVASNMDMVSDSDVAAGRAEHAIGIDSDVRPDFDPLEVDKYGGFVDADITAQLPESMVFQVVFRQVISAQDFHRKLNRNSRLDESASAFLQKWALRDR